MGLGEFFITLGKFFMKLGKLLIDTKTGVQVISTSDKLCIRFEQYIFPDEQEIWEINHIFKTETININVFVNNTLIYPENIVINDEDTILIYFSEPLSGFANVLFYTNQDCPCDDVINPTPTPTPTITITPVITVTPTITPTITPTSS